MVGLILVIVFMNLLWHDIPNITEIFIHCIFLIYTLYIILREEFYLPKHTMRPKPSFSRWVNIFRFRWYPFWYLYILYIIDYMILLSLLQFQLDSNEWLHNFVLHPYHVVCLFDKCTQLWSVMYPIFRENCLLSITANKGNYVQRQIVAKLRAQKDLWFLFRNHYLLTFVMY